MKCIISKLELQQLILWGNIAQDNAKEYNVPFEVDEFKLLEKLRKLREREEASRGEKGDGGETNLPRTKAGTQDKSAVKPVSRHLTPRIPESLIKEGKI